MQFRKLGREGAENVFRTVLNVEGAVITTGMGVALANGVSNDGVQAVVANAAADYIGFIGIAKADIANNDYGLVQISGFVNSVLLSNAGTSITINAGDCLIPAPTGGFYSAAAPTYANAGFKRLFASNVPVAVSAAGYASGLLVGLS